MANITDSTCTYGLAQTAAGCVRTLASYDRSAYHTVQIVYLTLGSVSVVASVILYVRSVKHESARLQQYSFLFCCYGAVTMVIRGADPMSYDHVIPLPISALLADTCTAALYSVYILALGYWATIIQRGAAVTDKPAHLICMESIAVAVVWTFQILYDMCLFLSKGFNPQGLVYMQLTVSASMLAVISTVFLIYGLRVLARLQEYERQQKLRMPTILSDRMMSNRSYDMDLSDDEDEIPVVEERSRARPQPQQGHAAKISKILFVVETASLVVIGAQMYMAVARTSETPVELSCANGELCDTVVCKVNLLHLFQIMCIWVILWTFRRIQKKAVVPRPHMIAYGCVRVREPTRQIGGFDGRVDLLNQWTLDKSGIEERKREKASAAECLAATTMGLNVTDATCDFGLAQTAEGCVRTLASYDQDVYLHYQIIYCVVGAVSVVASGIMYWRAAKHDGSPLQLNCFLLCCYASFTVVIRGADPTSYGHIIPRPISGWLSDSCTASLYSVYILALGYWATIIQQGAAVIHKPTHLKCLENSTIAFVWAFYTVYDMSLFAFKGFQPLVWNYVQLAVSAGVLAIISSTFLIYGLRVLARLQEYERQLKLRMPSTDSEYMVSNHSYDMDMSDDEDGIPVAHERRFAPRRPKQGHTTKIKKILFVAETVSLVVIAGQMYMVTRVSSTPVELSCANGMLCSTVKLSWRTFYAASVRCTLVGNMLGMNITDSTCDFGLAQTAAGCARTLASYDSSAYLNYQIGYCVVGVVSVIGSFTMYWRAVKYDGSPLQHNCFLFCSYASVTMIFRGIDPTSYGHIVPRYWATVIQQGAAVIHRPTHLKCLEYSAIAFVWVFYTAYNMSLFAFKGFQPPMLNYIQLGVSAGVLAIMSTGFLIYGLRVLARLQEYERQLKLRMPSTHSEYMVSNHSYDMTLSDDEDGVPVVEERRYARPRPKEGHGTKIKKILLVAESVSVIVIAGQLYMAVTSVSNSPVELSCANGMLCETVKSKLSLLHTLQVTLELLSLWLYGGWLTLAFI
ncbi:hypothetical protein BBJ28_00015718 [Nothophytophthora sp. Chile5]|nr:hypothetical protein BBJ28_00015718 [Nothophytophthora sp. Chile5]